MALRAPQATKNRTRAAFYDTSSTARRIFCPKQPPALLAAVTRWGLVALMTLPFLVIFEACHSERTLNEEHSLDLEAGALEPLTVIDHLPPSKSDGVPKNMQPYFFFNREIENPEELELAVVNATGNSLSYYYEMDFDNAGITFFPSTVLYAGEDTEQYEMALTDDEEELDASSFSVDFPPGLIFNMSTDLKCTEFGGSFAQAKLLNTYFDPGVYPLWIMVTEDIDQNTSFPTTTNLHMGPGYIRSSGAYRIYRHIGFSATFPNTVVDEHGHFIAYRSGAFFPLDTPSKVVLSYMQQMRIEGTFDLSSGTARIRDLTVSGVFPARSLLMLSDESDVYAEAINTVNLNVDLNENGVDDACTFKAQSNPEEIPPDMYDP